MRFTKLRQLAVRFSAPARLLGGWVFISVFSGCAGTPSTTISTDASRVFNPSLRVAIDIDDSPRPASEPQSGKAFEIEAGRAKGGGYQTLATGQAPVIINNTTFSGPQQLRNDFDFSYAKVSFRWRKFFGERQRAGIELAGGLGYAALGLTVSSPAQRDSGRFGNMGAQGSVGFIWCMRQSTSLHLRLSTFRSPNAMTYQGVTSADAAELSFEQALGDNLSLRAGYTSLVVDGSTGPGSDFHTTFSGPMVNLGLNF